MIDYSTLDTKALYRLEPYLPDKNERREPKSGNSIFLKPPGYPTYFMSNVFNNDMSPASVSIVLDFAEQFYVVEKPSDWLLGYQQARADYPDGDIYEIARDINRRKWKELTDSLWIPLPVNNKRSIAWIKTVYAFFAGCYSLEDDQNSAFDHIIFSDLNGKPDATPYNHCAYRFIRRYYPDYRPRVDLITLAPGYDKSHWWATEDRQIHA